MSTLAWIVVGGILMSAIALVGGVTTVLRPGTLERVLLPLVSLSAGTLIGGAFFHMIPAGSPGFSSLGAATWVVAGFTTFLGLEQLLQWHQCRRGAGAGRRPAGTLILIGDGLHNFIGGLGVTSAFLVDPRVGISAWLAAAAHEIPQELGDFGVLVHSGWKRPRALLWNFLSGTTFLAGGLVAYGASRALDVATLVLFGAGNFLYIAAADLVPEIQEEESLRLVLTHFACFVGGVALMLGLAYGFGPA